MKKYIILLVFFLLLQSFSFAIAPNFEIYSASAILVNAKTGEVLFEKNAYQKAYPASTTKILTALVALSKESDLSKKIIPSRKAVLSVPAGSSIAYFSDGEELTLEQVLYGLLLPSGNDAANIIAEEVSGSSGDFAGLMNETAKKLGALNSNFKNPSGIHDNEHYTTAYDLSLFAREAMKFPKFREIVSTYKYTMPATNRSKNVRLFTNTNQLIASGGEYYFEYAKGIKTGYTSQAGNCLVSYAIKDNVELISVVLGGYAIPIGKSASHTDSINLLNFGFNNYYNNRLVNANSLIKQVVPQKSNGATLDLIAESSIDVLVENGTSPDFKQIITLNPVIKAPISAGDVMGTISCSLGDKVIGISNLLARTDIVREPWYMVAFKVLLTIIISVIILCVLLRLFNEIRKFIRKKGKR